MIWRSARVLSVLFLAGALVLPAAGPVSAQGVPQGPGDPAELAAFLDGVFAAQMNTDHVPGAVAAVVRDGELLYAKGYGYASLDGHVPVDPERTLFRVGSVSKLFIWTALMQLAEQGKLALDADVNTYLDFEIPATYPEPVTLAHLLAHTPGFEDSGQDLFKLQADQLTALDVYLKTHVPARVFPPGTLGAYSNYGAALAGYVVERVSGQPFDAYVEQHILQPLGMEHSTFRQPLPAALAGDMARGYNYWNGAYVEGGFEFVTPYPAGSMSASAADLARFMIAHLQDGRYGEARILSEAGARQMHSRLFSHDPRLPGMAHGFFESEVNGRRVLSHGGDTLLFHSGLFLLPEENVGLFLSTNATGGAKTYAAVFKAFMEHYYPVAPRPGPTPLADGASRAEAYTGEYYSTRSNFSGVEKVFALFQPISVSVDEDGYIVASVLGETTQFVELEPGLFQGRDDPAARAVLKTDASGQTYILTPDPFAFVKTPWYAGSGFQGLIFLGSLLLFLVTLAAWAVSFVGGLLRRESRPWGARLARLAGGLFMLVFIVFLVAFIGVLADIDPAYGVPRLFFEAPAGFDLILLLPPLLAVLGVLMLVFLVLAWKQRYWSLAGRLHYTLLVFSAAGILWALNYWNLLL